jgi:dihydrofolate reductase
MTNEQSFDWTPLSETFKTAADAAADVTPERSRGLRKVIVTEFISLDGVIGEPQNWSFPYWGDDIAAFKNAELFGDDTMAGSDTMLLGRVTYEGFAQAWPGRKGADPFSTRFNEAEKVVVSNTLTEATWENSHVLQGDLATGVNELKSRDGGDIYVHGSKMLVKSLMDAGLVDRFHLIVYPLVLGEGVKLFDEGKTAKLKLVEARPFASGAVAMIYEPAE